MIMMVERKDTLTFSALKSKTDIFTNSVDPDETAHNEPSHQDPQCLQEPSHQDPHLLQFYFDC